MIEMLKAIILGIVQGITEWLPVSSTGHLILVEQFVKFNLSDVFVSTFMVVIQLGSILAVLTLYFKKLNPLDSSKTEKEKNDTIDLWIKVIIAVIPSVALGLPFDDLIDSLFFNPTTVSITLIFYGVIMIIIESRNKKPKVNDFSQLTYKLAFYIGLFQCLALIPGTSRSGATIIGATLLGTSRYIAAEFSFFLAIPTMFGASALKLWKAGAALSGFEWSVIGVGFVTAFIVSVFAIKFLMDYIKKHDFKVFGYYRIVLGIIVITYFSFIA